MTVVLSISHFLARGAWREAALACVVISLLVDADVLQGAPPDGRAKGIATKTKTMHVRFPGTDVAYVHVYDRPGSGAGPLFSLLLPEFIRNDGVNIIPVDKRPVRSYMHMQPSKWEDLGRGRWRMTQTHPGYLTYEVSLTPKQDALYLGWRLRNDTQGPWRRVTGNFCSATGWLPFIPPGGWRNADFQPGPPPAPATSPGRAQQTKGMVKRWLNDLLRKNVWVHTPTGWRPYPDGKKDMDVALIACRSLDGKKLFAQAWDQPAQPSHGPHLCIHLVPMVAEELRPGQWACARGAIYLIEGTLDQLLDRYRRDFSATKTD
jgi:hypothetical protein